VALISQHPEQKTDIEAMQKEMSYFMLATFADVFSDSGESMEESRNVAADAAAARDEEPAARSSGVMADAGQQEVEPHALDESSFYRKVQSFEFWFEAVGGYLATQVADEARHLEVSLHRLEERGVENQKAEIMKRAHPSIVAFRQRLLDLVAAGDWEAAVFARNVLLETMEFTVFRYHARTADRITRQVLEGVISDERRHLGFGENDIGRLLARRPEVRGRLADVRRELDPLVLGSFEGAFEDLGIARSDRPDLGRDYLRAVERLGFVT